MFITLCVHASRGYVIGFGVRMHILESAYVGLMGIVQMLIQKSTGMVRRTFLFFSCS